MRNSWTRFGLVRILMVVGLLVSAAGAWRTAVAGAPEAQPTEPQRAVGARDKDRRGQDQQGAKQRSARDTGGEEEEDEDEADEE